MSHKDCKKDKDWIDKLLADINKEIQSWPEWKRKSASEWLACLDEPTEENK